MRKFFKKVNRGLTLTNKLVLMFIALAMIPVIIVGFVSTGISGNVLKEKEIARRKEELRLIDNEISDIFQEIDLTAIKYKIDPNVQKLFTQHKSIDVYDINLLEFEIEKLIFTFGHQRNYVLDSTYIFSLDGIVCTNESYANVTLADYYKRDWFKKGIESGQTKFIGDAEIINNNRVIPYVRRITDVANNETIGFIVININESFIRSAYLNSFPSSTASLMIVNDNGVILSHTERKYTGEIASDAYEIDEEYLKEPYFDHSLQGKNMLIIGSESEKEPWTYYSIVLMSEVNAGSAVIYRITLALVGAVILFIVFLSYFLSKRVTNPLRELSSVMKKAETGNLDVSYSGKNYDEIGKLGDSFNKMTKKLKKSMQETISVQKEKMEAELKGLEFQINPHFLYNTLSSIIWLADEGRNDEVIKVTKSLASFFRISISRGREMIRVREEVEHVINYMEIQKTRYGDVMFMHDVDMEIRGFYTLKLLLQPIIENAIYHGIKAIKGRGIIKLRGKREGDDLVFLISDNGNKMDKQRAEELNKALSGIGDRDLGVGLKNVNNRIKLHFGQHYGLKFGVMDGYTVVEIRIPVIESEEEDDV